MTEDKKMDFRERARNIHDALNGLMSIDWRVDIIAQALLESRNEALEEATVAVRDYYDCDGASAKDAVRSLKC